MSDARIIRADRTQPRFDVFDLEALLPRDHKARVVWAFVEDLEIEALYDSIKSREGAAGRPAADPRVLLALWIYATVEGVGSARHLERLAEREVAFRWLAGGVALNYHGLADLRPDQSSGGRALACDRSQFHGWPETARPSRLKDRKRLSEGRKGRHPSTS